MALLEIKNLSFTYSGGDSAALKNVSLTVEEGDLVLLCGDSGCGKTTLMRLIKQALAPVGDMSGEIFFRGENIKDISQKSAACDIGYVMQNPETQIITDTCVGELAFGLQSLGMSPEEIDAKIGEVAGFFGIGDWWNKKTRFLSGGQKQLLSLAAVMAMKPSLLLLDEPTSQLDPVSAREFLNCLKKLGDELGVTVIMSEHRLEDAFPMADKVIMMKNGGILLSEKPREIGRRLWAMPDGDQNSGGLPAAVRIYRRLGGDCPCPVTVREGKGYIARGMKNKTPIENNEINRDISSGESIIKLKNISFGYDKASPLVISGLDMEVKKGELLCLLGGNGCGKTTLLKLICGLLRPLYGEYRLGGKKAADGKKKGIAYLPQNQLAVFTGETVVDCFNKLSSALGMNKDEAQKRRDKLLTEFDIARLADRHPYDISGGEQQRTAIALALFTDPGIILLDEPTKGQDAHSKARLAELLKVLTEGGKTVVMATHDLEFASEYADRCGLLFGGRLVSLSSSDEFFSANDYYTTAAARITRPFFRSAVTVDRAVKCCADSGFAYE